MRIKRIEITGFKSFCDRAVVTIDDAITAVVGPNGCGKSNIVDAIRWCMGEQSAKHLRGKAMEDVIFAGSETRGPAPMAEVSLTFDEVGFSHEILAQAQAVEKETQNTLTAVGETNQDLDGQGIDSDNDTEIDNDAADLDAPGPSAVVTAAAPAAVYDENGVPIASAADAVRDFLVDASAPDLSAYSEVTITRRLFRDGTSHYLLNKTPCRLRDITDFFLGTGVGTKAYAIIEQGRVGQIVSSRPADRRFIIEEAAGVTKFKSKKKAAERKLEQTKQNLLRVTDIVVELEKRLGALRRQAQKAERFRQYRNELRDLELWKASHRYLELHAQLSFTGAALQEASNTLGDVRSEFAAQDGVLAAARAELVVEERALASLQEKTFELENQCQLLAGRAEMDAQRATEAGERAERAARDRAEVESQRDAKIAELAAHDQARTTLAAAHEEATRRHAACDSRVAELREHQIEVTTRLDQLRARAAELRAQETARLVRSEAATRDFAATENRASQVGEEHSLLATQVRSAERDLKRVDDALADARQMRFDLGNQHKEFLNKSRTLTAELSAHETRADTLRTELQLRKSRLVSLEEIAARYEGFARGTRALITEAAVPGVRGLMADHVRVPQEYEAAAEAALGEQLGGMIVETPAVGLSAIDYLKTHHAGRSSLVPLTGEGRLGSDDREQVTSLREVVAADGESTAIVGQLADLVTFSPEAAEAGQRLVGGWLVVSDLASAIKLRARTNLPMVTLAGDVVDARGVIAGGSREEAGHGMLGQRREIRELSDMVATLGGELAEVMTGLVMKKAELSQCQKALEQVTANSHQGDLTIIGHEKDHGRYASEVERLRSRLSVVATEQHALHETLEDLRRELANATAGAATFVQAISDAEAEQLATMHAARELTEAISVAGEQLTNERIRVAQLSEQLSTVGQTAQNLRLGIEGLVVRHGQIATEISADTARAAELAASASALRQELMTITATYNDVRREVMQRRADYEGRLSGLSDLDALVRDLRQRAEGLADTAGHLDRKAAELSVQRSALLEAVQERHGEELVDVVADYHARHEPGPDADSRINELRDLVAKMGTDINLTAIEECADVSQRHTFLSTQKQDLELALAQLEEAIAKINATSRQLFSETFEAVNTTFQRVFPRLFRGGQARLSLVAGEDGDVLEAGVEIMAQPPGKKNTTVDQLSGGEKALTAVALIFSIFLIKPSPFCILDEVDAPLDEANVDRYNEIVREMTDRSQFIVISHNKRTMESADHLYGVTMQEPGVSKLVAVHLSRLTDQGRPRPSLAAAPL